MAIRAPQTFPPVVVPSAAMMKETGTPLVLGETWAWGSLHTQVRRLTSVVMCVYVGVCGCVGVGVGVGVWVCGCVGVGVWVCVVGGCVGGWVGVVCVCVCVCACARVYCMYWCPQDSECLREHSFVCPVCVCVLGGYYSVRPSSGLISAHCT